MAKLDFNRKSTGNFKRAALILSLSIIFLVAAYIVYKLFFVSAPVIEGVEAFNFFPSDKTITLKVKHVKSIDIYVQQAGKKIDLFKDITAEPEKAYTIQVRPKDIGLSDGQAVVFVHAKAGIFKVKKFEIKTLIDTIPPALDVLKAPEFISQGTGGFALLRAKDADSVFVKLDKYTFKAFKASGPGMPQTQQDAETYFVFFPAPFAAESGKAFYATAKDAAGNQNIRALPTKLKKKIFKESSLDISDAFINAVVPPILNETNISDPAGAFKKVNEEIRGRNLKELLEIAEKTAPEILWKGSFLQLKNTQVMAQYGDRRTYLYNGKPISKSVHLGYDLASVKNAPVEAANSGLVVFADNFGIYGNTVIIDHGFGLMSLYGHLSSIDVKKGTAVEKGGVIAKTGATGLAGGDHLHFGILMHGYEISPLEWLDSHWIQVNVLDYMKQ